MSMSKNLAGLINRVEALPKLISDLEVQINAVAERMAVLKKDGLIYASGHWRQQKYFMLVYPQVDGERPSPTYIGTDPEKIQKAQLGMERAKEYDDLAKVAKSLEHKVYEAQIALTQLERALTLR